MPNPFNQIPMPPASPIATSGAATISSNSSINHDSDSEDRFITDNGDYNYGGSDINRGILSPHPILPSTTTAAATTITTVNNSNSATLPATTMANGGGGIGGLTGGSGGAVGGVGGIGVGENGTGINGQSLNGIPPTGQYYPPGSVINLSNSNDVVIGPMTQYQGAVTIYQYMDATVETSHRRGPVSLGLKGNNNNSNNTNIQSNNGEPTVPKKKCSVFDLQNIQTWLLITVLIIIGVGVGIAIYLALLKNIVENKNEYRPQQREILFGNEYEDETIPNLGDGHLVIDRKQWGAGDLSINTTMLHLKHPITKIIITHIGVQSKPCDTVYNCSIKMRTIQDAAIAEKGHSDLPANFYVSNDGYIYVGRGWNVSNIYANESLAVCFMGDYIRFEPTQRQLEGVQYLLSYGVARQFIAIDYHLIAHNQTKSTKSPGSNVYKKIIKWPHWYACGVNNNPKCDW